MTTGDDTDPDRRWRLALREPFATVRTAAGELERGRWPADPTAARVVERLVAAPAAEVLLEAVGREIPIAVQVGGDLPAGPAALTPDGGYVVVVAGGRVEVWDRGRGRMTWSRELPGMRRGREVAARGPRSVVVGSARDGSVDLVAVEPNDTATIGTVTGSLRGLGIWEPDRLVTVTDDGGVTVWSLAGGPARRMAAPSAAVVEDAVVEDAVDRVVLTRRGGQRWVLDLVTGDVAEVAPAPRGVTLTGGAVRVAVDPAGRLRATSGGADGDVLGTVASAVGEGTRLVAAPDEPLLVVSDVDSRLPTTVWNARGAMVHDAVRRPLLTATPEQLALVDAIPVDGLSEAARQALLLFREVLALRLRDAVEIAVEAVDAVGGPPRAGSSGSAPHGPGPRDVEIDEPRSGDDPGPEARVPAALGGIRAASWWGR